MAIRLKTRWHESKRVRKGKRNVSTVKTIEDRASVVGFNIWKVVQQTLRNMMEEEEFSFKDDRQTFVLITEMLAFLVNIVDRMVYGQISEEDRGKLINTVAQHLGNTLHTNMMDTFGEGEYVQPFYELLNNRFGEYAECSYENGGPGFNFKRVAAAHIAEVMQQADNKWVLEWVMDIEIPKAVPMVQKLVAQSLGVKVQ